MKKVLSSLLFAFTIANLSAQVKQNGMVREQNSKYKPVLGVQVNFADAVPTTSDDAGNFQLAFQDKKPGDLIFFQKIQKEGYEIVNEKDLQVLKIGNTSRLGKDIILAEAGKLNTARKKYYDISDEALLAGFNKEKKALQSKLEKAQLTEKQFEARYFVLLDQYEGQQKSLDDLSDLFARVNFDDVSMEYKRAFDLFEKGKVNESLKILENTNLLTRMEKRLKEKKRIEAARDTIIAQKEMNEREIREDLQGLHLQGQLYVLTFQIEKAERIYDQLLKLDSTDIQILSESADFYRENHFYDKALRWYPLMCKHPKAEAWEIAKTYVRLGDLNALMGNLDKALAAYHKSSEGFENLIKSDPTRKFYIRNLAISYGRIGEMYMELSDANESFAFFEKHHQLNKLIYESYPNDIDSKHNLALSFQEIGIIYYLRGNFQEALRNIQLYNDLMKTLCNANPDDNVFKSGLANSFSRLGAIYATFGDETNSLIYYEKSYALLKDLQEAYPKNVDYKYELSRYAKALGEAYRYANNFPTALIYFKQQYKLTKELEEKYPQNKKFVKELGDSFATLGIIYTDLGNLEEAFFYQEQSNMKARELYETCPKCLDYKSQLGLSCVALSVGYMFKNDLGNAKKYLKEAEGHFMELRKISPENTVFKSLLEDTQTLLKEIK